MSTTYKGRKVFPGMSVKRYPCVYWPNHLRAQHNGCVYVHQDVALDKYGIESLTGQIHHKDENVWNWEPENIVLLENRSEHAKLHADLRASRTTD